jgi:GTP-binding protein HflX
MGARCAPGGGQIEAILVDHEISPSQARNLEVEVGCEVMDRTMVILEIFHRNARSRAARAQVEIARLGYMAPRLREMAKLAGPQGASAAAWRPGCRRIPYRAGPPQDPRPHRRAAARNRRHGGRAQDPARRRQERQGLATVALVGYTNAGKST